MNLSHFYSFLSSLLTPQNSSVKRQKCGLHESGLFDKKITVSQCPFNIALAFAFFSNPPSIQSVCRVCELYNNFDNQCSQ